MTATILSIIGGLITIVILVLTRMNDKSKQKKEEQDAEDKKIDSANNADDLLREFDKLRNK